METLSIAPRPQARRLDSFANDIVGELLASVRADVPGDYRASAVYVTRQVLGVVLGGAIARFERGEQFLVNVAPGRPRGPRYKIEAALALRDGDGCAWCSKPVLGAPDCTYDHVIPRVEGGPRRLDNLILACAPCNEGRSNSPVPMWAEQCRARGQAVRDDVIEAALARVAELREPPLDRITQELQNVEEYRTDHASLRDVWEATRSLRKERSDA